MSGSKVQWPGARRTTVAALLAGAFICSTAAAAPLPVSVELNKLEQAENACRAFLVFHNETQSTFDVLKFDLVLFDTDGLVVKRVGVDTGPLPGDKISLKVFDIAELPCERIGRVLLNTVVDCADTSGPRQDCLNLISTSARGAVEFVK